MKKIKQGNKKNAGITLVALTITIIVLLILAGITINLTIGEDGILKRAEEAGKNYTNAADYERNQLAELFNQTDRITGNVTQGTDEYISSDINDFEPIVQNVAANFITVKIPEIQGANFNSIVGYAYLLNGEVKGYTTEKQYMFMNLNAKESYKIKVIAMDKYGKIKYSNEITQQTTDEIVQYLYNRGVEYEDITGGWVSYAQSNASCQKEEGYIYLVSNENGRGTQTLTSKNMIDLTNYDKLVAIVKCNSFKDSSRPGRIGIYNKNISSAVFSEVTTYTEFITNGIEQKYELDISGISGENVIVITGQPEAYIYEIYLK